MANLCANRVTLFHEDSAKMEQVRKGWETGLFSAFLPLTDVEPKLLWGTSFDVDKEDGNLTETIDGTIITFATAWCPPIEFYNHLVELGFEVDATYFEPGCKFYGYYFDGADDCNDYEELDELPEDIVEEYELEDWNIEYDDE